MNDPVVHKNLSISSTRKILCISEGPVNLLPGDDRHGRARSCCRFEPVA